MPTIRKTTAGAETIHGHGRVAGGETIDVVPETATFLVDEQGTYEYADATDSDSGGEQNVGTSSDEEPDTVTDAIESGICPWCPEDDRYEGDGVPQHASSAHPEEWDAYKGGDS